MTKSIIIDDTGEEYRRIAICNHNPMMPVIFYAESPHGEWDFSSWSSPIYCVDASEKLALFMQKFTRMNIKLNYGVYELV